MNFDPYFIPPISPAALKIAHEARAWVEELAVNINAPSDLCGFCGIATGYLLARLHAAEFQAEAVVGNCHCFVLLDDHIIDITATQMPQYSNQRVVVKHVRDVKVDEYWWEVVERAALPYDLHIIQCKDNWPVTQTYDPSLHR